MLVVPELEEEVERLCQARDMRKVLQISLFVACKLHEWTRLQYLMILYIII